MGGVGRARGLLPAKPPPERVRGRWSRDASQGVERAPATTAPAGNEPAPIGYRGPSLAAQAIN